MTPIRQCADPTFQIAGLAAIRVQAPGSGCDGGSEV